MSLRDKQRQIRFSLCFLDTGLFKKTAYVVSDENGYALSCYYYFVPKDNIMTASKLIILLQTHKERWLQEVKN
uniref:Uncharacterized protein n=1 Tax=viral metagenome TaxID=1070528 RepID=A0A6C0I4M5_9ZZZZ